MLVPAHREAMTPDATAAHRPVLRTEVLDFLRPRPGGVYVDGTVGLGGHAEALLEATSPDGRLLGIDRDGRALALCGQRLARFGERVKLVRGDHRDVFEIAHREGVVVADGVLLDLGVSSLQLDDPERGFSFRQDGPLDMRMDPASGPTAAELLRTASERELARILRLYGEEPLARPIARAIARRRQRSPILRTAELAALVESVAGARGRRARIHPATRTFQALRIAVNRELEQLDRSVTGSVALLRRGGRLVTIAFHSLEDRVVKHALGALASRCVCPPRLPVCACGRENLVRVLTPKPLRPAPREVAENPRSRSARLRAAERL